MRMKTTALSAKVDRRDWLMTYLERMQHEAKARASWRDDRLLEVAWSMWGSVAHLSPDIRHVVGHSEGSNERLWSWRGCARILEVRSKARSAVPLHSIAQLEE